VASSCYHVSTSGETHQEKIKGDDFLSPIRIPRTLGRANTPRISVSNVARESGSCFLRRLLVDLELSLRCRILEISPRCRIQREQERGLGFEGSSKGRFVNEQPPLPSNPNPL
jgi:hypothetical protein